MRTVAIVDADFYASKHYIIHAGFEVNGRKTGVPFGMVYTLNRMVKIGFDEIYVCWGDHRDNLWRKDKLESYKAHRSSREGFYPQVQDTQNILEALGISQYLIPKWEADDVIAQITRNLEPEGCKIKVLTADHDMLQLCSENVTILQEKSKSYQVDMTPNGVYDRYGVYPKDLVTFFAYVGEKGDGIPGVRGIGKKRAAEIINGTRKLPGDDVTEKLQNMGIVNRNRQLIRLDHDVPMNQNQLESEPEPDPDYIAQIAATLRFGERWQAAASSISAWVEASKVEITI